MKNRSGPNSFQDLWEPGLMSKYDWYQYFCTGINIGLIYYTFITLILQGFFLIFLCYILFACFYTTTKYFITDTVIRESLMEIILQKNEKFKFQYLQMSAGMAWHGMAWHRMSFNPTQPNPPPPPLEFLHHKFFVPLAGKSLTHIFDCQFLLLEFVIHTNCSVFWIAFGCCTHLKAGWNTFCCCFQLFLLILDIF